jgi:hypothetical protein
MRRATIWIGSKLLAGHESAMERDLRARLAQAVALVQESESLRKPDQQRASDFWKKANDLDIETRRARAVLEDTVRELRTVRGSVHSIASQLLVRGSITKEKAGERLLRVVGDITGGKK